MTKYPALYASLRPATVDGHSGSEVTCTATLQPIGFIWWTCIKGTEVVWHYRTIGLATPELSEYTGNRTTERNAVQALRDARNQSAGTMALPEAWVPLAGPTPVQEPRRTQAAPQPRPMPASSTAPIYAPPAPARKVVWDDDAPAFDLTAAIAAGLKAGGR